MRRRIRVGAITPALAAATITPAGAADTLLSQGKPVTASSAGGCCPAPDTVDGDAATPWAGAAGVDPQWIYVDLGAAAHISRVRLQWDASCATAYEIDTSADHVTWTKIYATTTGKGGVEDLTSLDGTGRYVRVYGTKRCRTDASKGYSLREFGVYGSAGDVVAPSPPGTPTLAGVTPTSATIAWTAASDDVGVAGYDVYRDGQLCARTTGALTATCGNLGPNGSYGFYVNARDAAGKVDGDREPLKATIRASSALMVAFRALLSRRADARARPVLSRPARPASSAPAPGPRASRRPWSPCG